MPRSNRCPQWHLVDVVSTGAASTQQTTVAAGLQIGLRAGLFSNDLAFGRDRLEVI
ncbi:MAG: hypothetical protein ACRD3P_06495 [Terriglobales bacterium]